MDIQRPFYKTKVFIALMVILGVAVITTAILVPLATKRDLQRTREDVRVAETPELAAQYLSENQASVHANEGFVSRPDALERPTRPEPPERPTRPEAPERPTMPDTLESRPEVSENGPAMLSVKSFPLPAYPASPFEDQESALERAIKVLESTPLIDG